ncbi:hypothetical protein E3V36_05545 [Candidatus Marinimicrobia bacterium MT.SAG.2]|nr:hypothetical protein E3V36_05545 [Candidatus Marinimicrobia bacterium MT.SAG.2]
MELTPEDRKRIYEEEKARIEAEKKNESNKKIKPNHDSKKGKQGLFILLSISAVLWILSTITGVDDKGKKSISNQKSTVAKVVIKKPISKYACKDGKRSRPMHKSYLDSWGDPDSWSMTSVGSATYINFTYDCYKDGFSYRVMMSTQDILPSNCDTKWRQESYTKTPCM